MEDQKTKITELLDFARTFKGTPYVYGGRPRTVAEFSKLNGARPTEFDCSSFVAYLLWVHGVPFSEAHDVNTFEMAAAPEIPVVHSFAEAEPGDLLFFEGEVGRYNHSRLPGKYIGHVGIYAGDNMMIHSTHNAGFAGVVEHNLEPSTNPFYNKEKIVLIKRYIR